MYFIFDMIEIFKFAVNILNLTGWAEPYFIFCLPIPQYIGSVPQAYQQFMLTIYACVCDRNIQSLSNVSSIP